MTGKRLVWLLCPLLVAALVLETGRARRLWRASRIAAVVKSVTITASDRGRLSRQLLQHNLDLLRITEPLSPVEVALPIARGALYLLLDRPQAAVRAYHEALEIEPRGEIYAHLGRAHLKLGNRDAAVEAFRAAIVLDHTQRRKVRGYVPGSIRQAQPASEASEGTAPDARVEPE